MSTEHDLNGKGILVEIFQKSATPSPLLKRQHGAVYDLYQASRTDIAGLLSRYKKSRHQMDPLIKSQLLYQLSYAPTDFPLSGEGLLPRQAHGDKGVFEYFFQHSEPTPWITITLPERPQVHRLFFNARKNTHSKPAATFPRSGHGQRFETTPYNSRSGLVLFAGKNPLPPSLMPHACNSRSNPSNWSRER